MSTQEVLANAKLVIEEEARLNATKAAAIVQLREQRGEIDKALEVLEGGVKAKPKRPRKALSEEARRNMSLAQQKRHGKGGLQGSTEGQN